MCSRPSPDAKKLEEKILFSNLNGIDAAKQYTVPVYRENRGGSYIEFYAFDPNEGRMRRKRIKTNRIDGIKKRRQYAKEVINRLNDQLMRGWNPWIVSDPSNLITFDEAVNLYEIHIEKMMSNGYFRKETYTGYKSNIKILREFVSEENTIYYLYQFDRKFCVAFLDYVFIDRNNGAQTRNNYLNFLRVLSGFFVEKGYLPTRPTDGIAPISKRLYQKERTCIPLDVVSQISEYLKEKDPYFMMVCYILYYSFIRPCEITRLKICDFNLKEGTITVPASSSKNKKTQTVTMPKKVLLYGVELGLFSAPMGDYIFSTKLRPGTEKIDTKIFRDHWEKVRKALGLRKEWKFYSLKDTGITAMLKDNLSSIDVRDQARHSSLSITEIYTAHSNEVNPEIFNLDGAL